jgi:hypothetical protein
MVRRRKGLVELGMGLLYALLLDVAWMALIFLLPLGALVWVLVVVWAMAVLVVTGYTIAEERYLLAAGFWLGQLFLFTLWLFGVLGALSLLGRMQGAGM